MQPRRFEDFTGNVRDSGTQANFQACPMCGDDRWKVYVDPQSGKWFCFAHDGGGCVDTPMAQDTWASDILERLDGKDRRQERIDWSERGLPRWEPLSKRALRYLAGRNIDASQARRLGLVEMADRMRVIVPYFGPTGKVIYWSARAYSGLEDGPKYLGAGGKHPLYMLPDWRRTDELVLVEGAFDAIAVWQHTGRHVAALGGKSLPLYLQPELLSQVRKRLIVVLDSDALGSALNLQSRLAHKVDVTVVPLPPGEDPASLGASIKELMK